MSTIRSDLQQKAQSSVIQYAIFRWESALVLALAFVLFFLTLAPPLFLVAALWLDHPWALSPLA